MTKYSEFCKAFADGRKRYFDHRDACLWFADALVAGMIDYFQVPADHAAYRPLNEEPKERTTYTVHGAAHLGEDAAWHVGVGIRVEEAPNVEPDEVIVLHIIIARRPSGTFSVKLESYDEDFEVRGPEDEARIAFYDFVSEKIHEDYGKTVQWFKEGVGQTKRRIGF